MSVTIVPKGQSAPMRGKNMVLRALVGLGWDVNQGQSTSDLDLDVSGVARDASGNAVACAYYGDLNPVPYLTHTGDNLTGAGEGDDEQLLVDFSQIPSDIARIDFVVHVYEASSRGQSFGYVENAFCRVENQDTGNELVRTDLSAVRFDATGVLIASFVRNGPTFDFVAVQDDNPSYGTLSDFVNTTVA